MNELELRRFAPQLFLLSLLAIVGSFACGGHPSEMAAEAIGSGESKLRNAGPTTFDPTALGIVTISIDPNLRHNHDFDFCLGTLIRNGWVLTTRSCTWGVSPTDLTIQMSSWQHGVQSSRGSEIYIYPNMDVGLLKLASPFLIGGDRSSYVKAIGSGLPERTWVRCFGVDWSNNRALESKRFWANGNASWNYYMIDDPDQSLETWDHGGPCFLDNGGTDLGPIIGIIASVGVHGVHAAPGFLQDINWLADMIHLSQVAAANDYTSPRIQSTFDFLCLDVASASQWPYASVNQYTCHNGDNQQWYWSNPFQIWDETHLQSLVSANSGKCLEVGPNNHLRQNSCTGGSNQLFGRRSHQFGWALILPGRDRSHPTLCADVPGFDSTVGHYIQMYPCNGGRNQAWRSW